MMITKVFFKNYKAFNSEEVMDIKPITLLLGKNSSGKTSLTKLISMLSSSTECKEGTLLLLRNEANVRYANRYEDLFHRNLTTDMQLGVGYEDGTIIKNSYLMNDGKLFVNSFNLVSPYGDKNVNFFDDIPSTDIQGIFYKPVFDEMHIEISSLRFKVNYLGPIRKQLEPVFSYSGGSDKQNVGNEGQYAQDILLDSFKTDQVLYQSVSAWMTDYLEGQRLSIESNGPASGTYSLFVNRNDAKVNVVDVGQGLTQVLPVVIESYLPKTAEIEIVEQPALHLHPAAHSHIAERLVDSAVTMQKKYIIESHSKTFLLGIRKKVACGDISAKDVVIYFVNSDDDGSFLKMIHVQSDGSLDAPLPGVFEEDYELFTDILNKRR